MIKTCAYAALAALLLPLVFLGADATPSKGPHWEIAGRLSEACSCSVPCSCNFGQGASPHHYCWSMMSFEIGKGHYGSVKLDGLYLAGAHGQGGRVWYIDDRATPEQQAALEAIARHVLPPNPKSKIYFQTARVIQQIGSREQKLQIGDKGGFEADYIIGMDGKTPIIIENMLSWNVQHDIKAKTTHLYYKDQFGNNFDLKNTNSNLGKFDWTDKTPEYF